MLVLRRTQISHKSMVVEPKINDCELVDIRNCSSIVRSSHL